MEDDQKLIKMVVDQNNSKWKTTKKIKMEDNQKNQKEKEKKKNNITQFGCGTAPGNLVSQICFCMMK